MQTHQDKATDAVIRSVKYQSLRRKGVLPDKARELAGLDPPPSKRQKQMVFVISGGRHVPVRLDRDWRKVCGHSKDCTHNGVRCVAGADGCGALHLANKDWENCPLCRKQGGKRK